MTSALVAQYNDPIGAILFWFGLFVVVCLAVTYWGWNRAIRTLRDQHRQPHERQNVRDEIDTRTLRRLREEQSAGPHGKADGRAEHRPAGREDPTEHPARYCTSCGAGARRGTGSARLAAKNWRPRRGRRTRKATVKAVYLQIRPFCPLDRRRLNRLFAVNPVNANPVKTRR